MKFNKGAMFGLDARIALAIFGALSVISGAALYSAIQEAKVTATVTELEELSKAYQAYILDTGTEVPKEATPSAHNIALQTLELIKSSKDGWAGPYISYQEGKSSSGHPTHEFDHPLYTYMFYIRALDDNAFGSYTSAANVQKTCEGNSSACFNWVAFNNVNSLDFAKAIDKKIDGAEGANSGKLRVRLHGTNKYAIYYQIMPSLDR